MGEFELERLIVRLIGDPSKYLAMLTETRKKTEAAFRKMEELGRSLTKYVTVPLAAVGAISVKAFADFDNAMVESTSIMKVTEQQTARMRDVALSLSGRSKQAPAELAQSYFFLASAGKDAEQSMALLPQVMQFATAGAFDMALATDLLTDAQSALGMSSKDAAVDVVNMARLSDVLVKANVLANTSVKQVAEALVNDAGPAMRSFGIEMEQGVAVLAAMADQGNKGAAAGSEFARAIRLMSNAARTNADVFKRMNIEVFDDKGNFRDMADVVDSLSNALEGMSAEAKGAALEQLGFTALSQRAIMPLLGTGDAIRRYTDELRKAGGITGEVADKQMKSFTNQMKVLKNQITVVAIEIGEVLAPFVLKLVSGIRQGIDVWSSFSKEMKRTIVIVGGIAAALGPVLLTVGLIGPLLIRAFSSAGGVVKGLIGTIVSLVNPLKIVSVAFSVLAYSASLLLNPVTLIVGAIALWVHHIGGIQQAWDKVRETVANFVEQHGELIGFTAALAASIFGIVTAIVGVTAVWVASMGGVQQAWEGIKSAVSGVYQWTKRLISENKEVITTVVAMAIAITALVGTFKLLAVVVGIVNGLLVSMHIYQVAGIILWTTYATVIGVAKIAMALFNLQLALWKGLLIGGALASSAWTAAVIIAKTATMLWNAALVILNALLAPATLLAVVGTVGLLAAAFALVGSAVYAVYKAGVSVLNFLKAIPTASGPIAHISMLFEEWGDILKDVVRIAKTDMPGAFRLLQAGFQLAIAQIRDLWQPLWDFIVAGFDAAWGVASSNLKVSFNEAVSTVLNSIQKLLLSTMDIAAFADPTGVRKAIIASLRKDVELDAQLIASKADLLRKEASNLAKVRLDLAAKKFVVIESDEVRDARKEVERIRDALKKAAEISPEKKEQNKTLDQLNKSATDAAESVGELKREVQMLNAVRFGSSEALRQIEEYTEILRKAREPITTPTMPTTPITPVTPVTPTPPVTPITPPVVPVTPRFIPGTNIPFPASSMNPTAGPSIARTDPVPVQIVNTGGDANDPDGSGRIVDALHQIRDRLPEKNQNTVNIRVAGLT